jgi:hypothetical protein
LVGYIVCIIDSHVCRDIFGRIDIMYCRLPYVYGGVLPLKTLVLYIYRPRCTIQYNQQLYTMHSFLQLSKFLQFLSRSTSCKCWTESIHQACVAADDDQDAVAEGEPDSISQCSRHPWIWIGFAEPDGTQGGNLTPSTGPDPYS